MFYNQTNNLISLLITSKKLQKSSIDYSVLGMLTGVFFSAPVLSNTNQVMEPGIQQVNNEVLTVTSSQYITPVSSLLAPTITLDRETIVRSQAMSVLELLKRLPGISIAQSGGMGQQSSLFIRGTESRHVLVLIDGIRLNQANISGSSDLSQIPLALIHRIEYIRGAKSALYGSDAIGGVINIITYPETRAEQSSSVIRADFGSQDTQKYGLSTQLNLHDTHINGAAGFARSQGVDAVANMPEAGSIRQFDKDGYENQFAWLGIAHQFTPKLSGHLRAFGIKNQNQYDGFSSYSIPSILIDERRSDSMNFDSRLYWLNGSYAMQFIASHNQTKDYNFNDTLGKDHITSSLDDAKQNQLQLINTWRYGVGSYNLGGEWQQQRTKQTPAESLESNRTTLTNRAIYLTTQHQISKWLIESAFRHDHQSQFGSHQTYHVGASYPVFDGYVVSAMYGHAYKAPNLMQLYSQYGGNLDLKPEQSDQFEINVEGNFGEMDFKITAYKNQITDLIDYQLERYINTGNAEILGSELELKWQGDHIGHMLTFAYLDAKDKQTQERLLRRAPKQLDYQLESTIQDTQLTLNYHLADKRDDRVFDNDLFVNKTVKLPINQQIDIAISHEITTAIVIRGRISDIFNQQRETVYGYHPTGRTFSIGGEYRF